MPLASTEQPSIGDPFRKVIGGQSLAIPALAYNSFIDAALDCKNRKGSGRGDPKLSDRGGIILLQNSSGDDIDRFGVLAISSPILTPTDNLGQFQESVKMQGTTPGTTLGQFAISLEPIANGAIGRAVLSGLAIVQVNVTASAHQYADVADGHSDYLASGYTGSAQILWRESGSSGTFWAIVRLTNTAGQAGGLIVFESDLSPASIDGTPATPTGGLSVGVVSTFGGVSIPSSGLMEVAAPGLYALDYGISVEGSPAGNISALPAVNDATISGGTPYGSQINFSVAPQIISDIDFAGQTYTSSSNRGTGSGTGFANLDSGDQLTLFASIDNGASANVYRWYLRAVRLGDKI